MSSVIDINDKIQFYTEYNKVLKGYIEAREKELKALEQPQWEDKGLEAKQVKDGHLDNPQYWLIREDLLNKRLAMQTHNAWIAKAAEDEAKRQEQINNALKDYNENMQNTVDAAKKTLNNRTVAMNKTLTAARDMAWAIINQYENGELKEDMKKIFAYRQLISVHTSINQQGMKPIGKGKMKKV